MMRRAWTKQTIKEMKNGKSAEIDRLSTEVSLHEESTE